MARLKKGDPLEYITPIVTILRELKKKYPNEGLCKHLSTALEDYGDFWGTTDKEFLFALEKYSSVREIEDPYELESEESISKIIAESSDLSHILDEDEEEEDW